MDDSRMGEIVLFFQSPSKGNDRGGRLNVHDYGQQGCRNGTAEWIFHFLPSSR
jgi:hypothetical protein